MKLIVGLGNPGSQYEKTRHNVGFMFLDTLLGCPSVQSTFEPVTFHLDKKFEAEIAEREIDGEKYIFAKPQTFMNSSGRSVSKIMKFFKISPSDLIVALDDIDLPIGIIRIRLEGSSGGHNGLSDIISAVGTDQFTRIRFGILNDGLKSGIDAKAYVLDSFGKRELPLIEQSISEGVNYLLQFIGSKKDLIAHTLEIKTD